MEVVTIIAIEATRDDALQLEITTTQLRRRIIFFLMSILYIKGVHRNFFKKNSKNQVKLVKLV